MVQIHSPRPFLRTNNLPYTHIVDRRLVSGQEVRGQEREQVGVECTSRVAPQDRSSACQVRANTSETQSNAIVSGDGWRERCKENRNETLFLFSFLQTRNAKSHARQLQVVCLVGTAMPETQLCSFGLHRSLLRDFGSCPSCNVERCMKGKCPSWPGGRRTLSVRCQGRRGVAFIGGERRPLTEEADGSGAGLARKGLRNSETTYIEKRER